MKEKRSTSEIIKELDQIFAGFRQMEKRGKEYKKEGRPKKGWINYLRTNLNYPTKLIAKKMGKKFPQSIIEFEVSEEKENISLKNLREVGKAMGMELVYGFVPISSASMQTIIKRKIAHKVYEEFRITPYELREPGKPKDISNNSALAKLEREMYYALPKTIWE